MTESEHPHFRWLRETADQIESDYERLHKVASEDPQRAGHGGESTWAGLLTDWLPRSYEVVTRRYIVPEEGDDTFETDVIVISPGYPRALRGREEIMAGGVAAAFSVKLTLDAEGITDAVDRTRRLRRAIKPRGPTARSELLGTFPIGLLAHSHDWKKPGSDPLGNVTRALDESHGDALHPREIIDLVCVADLSTWHTARLPIVPKIPGTPGPFASTAIVGSEPDRSPHPVAMFISYLYNRLSYDDSNLRGTADGLRVTGTWGTGSGLRRHWELGSVFSDEVRVRLLSQGTSRTDNDWLQGYF